MKLAKALKEKNRLVGEITRLKAIIQRENSREAKSTSTVDCEKLWKEFLEATSKLVAIKTAIFKANTGIYQKIAAMGEMKSQAEWIKSICTADGIVETPNFRGGEPTRQVFTAHLNQEAIDNMTVSLQENIARLQDELDCYNATVEIEIV